MHKLLKNAVISVFFFSAPSENACFQGISALKNNGKFVGSHILIFYAVKLKYCAFHVKSGFFQYKLYILI